VQQLPFLVQGWPTGRHDAAAGLATADRADSVNTMGATYTAFMPTSARKPRRLVIRLSYGASV
jgi:hypothetical protein